MFVTPTSCGITRVNLFTVSGAFLLDLYFYTSFKLFKIKRSDKVLCNNLLCVNVLFVLQPVLGDQIMFFFFF